MEIPRQFMIGSVDQLPQTQTERNSDLSQEDFLKIMAAAISMPSFSGDSGGGGKETDYLTQMAQFSIMDQLNEVATSLNTTMLMTQQQQAINLVGKQVSVAGAEQGIVSGTVEKVRFSNGYATIQVNGTDYSLNDILEVGESL